MRTTAIILGYFLLFAPTSKVVVKPISKTTELVDDRNLFEDMPEPICEPIQQYTLWEKENLNGKAIQ